MAINNRPHLAASLLAASVCWLAGTCATAGVLDAVRSEVREPSSSSSRSKGSGRPDNDCDDEGGSILGAILTGLFTSGSDDDCDDGCSETDDGELGFFGGCCAMAFYAAASPWWGPPAMIGDDYAYQSYFPAYPYQRDIEGYLMREPKMPIDGYTGSLRTRFEYADDWDNLSRLGGRVLWEHTSRFGLDSSFNYLEEQTGAATIDSLWMGDFNFVFRFAQSERVSMRTGLGFNWLADEIDSDFGFNFTYGGDFFFGDPWVASAEIDWGMVGAASLFHGRATIGMQLWHASVYTGYDYLNLEGVEIHGFVAGIELWF
ncbi:MAG: hypothetical protein WD030_05600 [Pirellulales bacterium]